LNAPGRVARETIESVLAGEVGAITGGRRAATVTLAVDAAVKEFRTLATGQATGRLAEAQKGAEAARVRATEAEAAFARFGESLDRLQVLRADFAQLQHDLSAPEHVEEVAGWRRDLEVARAADGRLREALAALGEARGRREGIDARLSERQAIRVEAEAAERAVATASKAVEEHSPLFDRAKATESVLAETLRTIRVTLEQSEEAASEARKAQQAFTEAQSLIKAFARLDAAQGLADHSAALRIDLVAASVTPEDLEALQALQARETQAAATLAAGAPTVALLLDASAGGRVTIDGEPPPGHPVAVTRPLSIDIKGIGVITVAPAAAAGVTAETAHRRAHEDLLAALAKAGVSDVSAARAGAERRRVLQAELQTALVRLEAACPPDPDLGVAAGLGPLQAALQGRERPTSPQADAAAVLEAATTADARLHANRSEERGAREARDAAGEMLRKSEIEQLRGVAAASETHARQERAAAALKTALEQATDEALSTDKTGATQAEARAQAAVADAERSAGAFDLEDLQRRLQHDEARQRNMQEDRTRFAGDIGRLEQMVHSEGENGPAATLEEAAANLATAEDALQRVMQEADALSLLRQVLGEASRAASRVYLEPVTRRMAPYVAKFLPGAVLELTDTMGLGAVNRAGRAEPAQSLSRGTQEQLAVLTRLAFADLLLEKGKPVSLVLDDTLVFSDDGRLGAMTDILTDASTRMQVTLMTCRRRAFSHLRANKLVLEAAASIKL
jgi:uncharacterized protein YhaN